MKKLHPQFHNRDPTSFIRHVLRGFEAGGLSTALACARFGISRARLHALSASYRTVHRKPWPAAVIDTLKRLLQVSPPAFYSCAASEVLRRHKLKLHRASVRRSAIENNLAYTARNALHAPACAAGSSTPPAPLAAGQNEHSPLLNMLDDCSRFNVSATLYSAETLLASLDFLPSAFLHHGLPLQLPQELCQRLAAALFSDRVISGASACPMACMIKAECQHCLAEVKQRGLITVIKPLIDELRIRARFWISDRLVERVLRDVAE